MDKSSATIFPHLHIEQSVMDKVLTSFDLVSVYLPWYVDIPSFLLDNTYKSHIYIHRPVKDHRPAEDFERLLKEYKLWIRQHTDRGVTQFLATRRETEQDEETIRQIRQTILRMERGEGPNMENASALKSHIILHLAMESEQTISETDQMLNQIKEQRSPVADLIEDNITSSPTIFEDLPVSKGWPSIPNHLIKPVLEAWIYLFGNMVSADEPLLTFDPDIFQYMEELFTDTEGTMITHIKTDKYPKTDTETKTKALVLKKQSLPAIEEDRSHENAIKSFLQGKTIILGEIAS